MRPDYWKLKASILDAQLMEHRALAQAQAARARLVQILTDAGLDPTAKLAFADEDEDVTEG